jgi:hypothetical protein
MDLAFDTRVPKGSWLFKAENAFILDAEIILLLKM